MASSFPSTHAKGAVNPTRQTANANTFIVLFSCEDRRGIVATVSGFINTHEGNIISAYQHHDAETNTFFMRVEWNMESSDLSGEAVRSAFEPIAAQYRMNWRFYEKNQVPRIAIFVSKELHCLYDLLLRDREGQFDAQVVFVASNHEEAHPIADWFMVPFHHFSMNKANKGEVEKEQIALLREQQVEVVVLARYMQILTENFVAQFPHNIINIHHSFLPAFIGARPYHQAFARGVKIVGATSHYVTAELDQGPIIDQDVTRISHRDSVAEIIRKGHNLERTVLERALRLHLERRILVFQHKTIIFE